jgi:hypothetical protein
MTQVSGILREAKARCHFPGEDYEIKSKEEY